MDSIAVLVPEHDVQAHTLLARCEGVSACTSPPCDLALCSPQTDVKAFAAQADGTTLIAIVLDAQAQARAREAGAAYALIESDVNDAFLTFALTGALTIAQSRSSLQASLEELEQQRSALLQISTLKSDLIATLAHDIKGPLTSIIGFAELLEEGFLEGTDAQDASRTIRTNAQRLAALANDILALSRVEYGELEIADDRVNLRDVLQKAIAEAQAERQIDVQYDAESAYVRGDAERLRQVFDNVIRNAIKYSPNGEPVAVDVRAEGDRLFVAVADRGIGIPADEMGKLFQRFGRTSNARKSKIAGTGVGLFIVKTIVERHSGSVSVKSKLGEGSTFTIALPALESGAVVAPSRVVIVTPDQRMRRFTAYELRARGFRVLELSTLEDAVGHIRNDTVLVDGDLGDAVRAKAMLVSAQRVIGLGPADSRGWDATLSKPFLIHDLLALLPGRVLARAMPN
jgi:signal transduction histidine kinase